jgi:hypothetical protein
MEAQVRGLSRETEEVLRRARLTEAMPVSKRRYLKAAVLARLAAGGIAFTAGEAAAGAGFWATAVGGTVKAVGALALVASLGAGGYMAARPSAPRTVATVAAVKPAPQRNAVTEPRATAEPRAPIAPRVEVEPSRARDIAPRAKVAVRASRPMPLVDTPVVAAPTVAPPPIVAPVVVAPSSVAAPPVTERSTLAEETRILREADRALRAGNAEAALALLDEHSARFPDGVLAPERSAERLVAMCQTGKADAATAARFLATRSGSPLAARVKQACNVAR